MKTTSDVPDWGMSKRKTEKKKKPARKIVHDSTVDGSPAKKVTVIGEYQELSSWRMVPITESTIERIAQELLDWAINDKDALRITDFFLHRRIPFQYLGRWRDKHPVLAIAHEEAMLAIASRRERGAIERKYDPGMIKFMQPHYDKDWKDMEAWRATLAEKNEKQGDIRVIIERFPSVSDVKEKE